MVIRKLNSYFFFEQPNDLSLKICLKCCKKLISYYKFKVLALKNNDYYENVTKSLIQQYDNQGIINKNELKYEIDTLESNNYNVVVKNEDNVYDEFNISIKLEEDNTSPDIELLNVENQQESVINLGDDVKENG